MSGQARIAYVGADKQLHLVSPSGAEHRQLTYGEGPGAQAPWGIPAARDYATWPCWSPDGQWLACFQIHTPVEGEASEAWLSVVEVDGVEVQRLSALGGGYPIYAQWNADSRKVAVLYQMEDQLELGICQLNALGRHHLVEQGVPLFFNWAPDGRRLLVHSGVSRGETRLMMRAIEGNEPDEVYPDAPGSFCTPIIVGDHSVYVARSSGADTLRAADLKGEGGRALAELEGLVAVVPDPTGKRVAFTAAPQNSNEPYDGVWITTLDGQEQRRVYEEGCVAFFWSGCGRRLLVAGRGPRAGFHWDLVDLETGETRFISAFYPSDDQRFFLHFFEQFAGSHAQISPDGRYLVYAAHPDSRADTTDNSSKVFLVDLDAAEAAPEEIAFGQFAVFSPGLN